MPLLLPRHFQCITHRRPPPPSLLFQNKGWGRREKRNWGLILCCLRRRKEEKNRKEGSEWNCEERRRGSFFSSPLPPSPSPSLENGRFPLLPSFPHTAPPPPTPSSFPQPDQPLFPPLNLYRVLLERGDGIFAGTFSHYNKVKSEVEVLFCRLQIIASCFRPHKVQCMIFIKKTLFRQFSVLVREKRGRGRVQQMLQEGENIRRRGELVQEKRTFSLLLLPTSATLTFPHRINECSDPK